MNYNLIMEENGNVLEKNDINNVNIYLDSSYGG